jgi:2,3-bisphosphoglycerate-dependent phosphoglycerate mutase
MRRRRAAHVAIVLELHATTVDTERWVATGWRDARLSTAGRRMAAELRDRRREDELDAVFASDLAAAAETARIAFGGRSLPILHDWRLRDVDLGELTGRPLADVEAVRERYVYDPFPGGESYVDVVARVRSALADVGSRCRDQRVVLVAHPATKIALDHVLEGAPLPELVSAPVRSGAGWTYTLAVDA